MRFLFQIGPSEKRLPKPVATSQWTEVRRRFFANRMAVAGLCVIAIFATAFVVGPLFWKIAPQTQNLDYGAQAPTLAHPFGTDNSGRDLLARAMQGGRISLLLGVAATFVSLVIGVGYGSVSAYVGGKTDSLMMRLVDILYALPFTLFVILLMTVMPRHTWVDESRTMRFFGLSTDIFIMLVAIGCVEWLTMARIVRAQVLSVKKREYVEAAKCLGYEPAHIIARHIVPNVLGPVIVYATLTIPSVILLESFISFLGLGVRAPNASWGILIRDGAADMSVSPWTLIIPAAMFSLTLLSFNFLGDGLRDALDPRSEDS